MKTADRASCLCSNDDGSFRRDSSGGVQHCNDNSATNLTEHAKLRPKNFSTVDNAKIIRRDASSASVSYEERAYRGESFSAIKQVRYYAAVARVHFFAPVD